MYSTHGDSEGSCTRTTLTFAALAFCGTVVGFTAATCATQFFATTSTNSGLVPPVRRLDLARRAEPSGLLAEIMRTVSPQATSLPVALPEPAQTTSVLSGSLSSNLVLAGVVATVLAVATAFSQSRKPALSLANSSGVSATTLGSRDTSDTKLRASPLDKIFDKRKTVVITGASSGLGLQCARSLANSGQWFVIMACRDVEKGKRAAQQLGLKPESYEVMNLELESFRSVRNFCKELRAKGRSLDTLVCNAALYLPNQRSPDFTEDGFERCFQVNHLSHFLMIRLLLDDIAASKHKRVVVVGSITGNSNTVGGGAVYPLADLGKLQGMKAGMQEPICMIDGKVWNGAKAYKDSKVCNMMTVRELHRRYHKQLGITFSTMYPGCIAESGLFRQKRGWFRTLFPLFMRYVTGGYVSQEEAGDRLAECVDSPATKKSGVYWSWNGGARTIAYFAKTGKGDEVGLTGAGGSGGALFENEPSPLVRDPYTANEMYNLSEGLCGLKPDPRAKNAEPALP